MKHWGKGDDVLSQMGTAELPPWRNVTGLGNNSVCSNGSGSAKKKAE